MALNSGTSSHLLEAAPGQKEKRPRSPSGFVHPQWKSLEEKRFRMPPDVLAKSGGHGQRETPRDGGQGGEGPPERRQNPPGAVPTAWETPAAPDTPGPVSEGRTGSALKAPGGTHLSLPGGSFGMGVCCSI